MRRESSARRRGLGEPARGRLLAAASIDVVARPRAELDERREPPERAAPLRVRMNAVVAREARDELVTHGRGADAQTRLLGRQLDAVDELDPRPRILREEQVAVEVDVVAEARDLRGGGDAETGLDHAAEHDAEAERAGRVRHPHRFADAAGLRELDVDPVRALGAGRDVVERVAVLVDVDRDRRRRLQARAVRVAGRAAAARSTRRRAPRAAAARRAPRRASSTRSRRPGAAARVTSRTARTRSTSRPSRAPSFSFRRRNVRRPSPHAAPCRPDRRARSSRTSAALRAPGRAAARRAGRRAFPADRGALRRSRPARPTRGRGSRCSIVVERKRIVAEHVGVLLDVRERGLGASRRSARSAPPRRNPKTLPCRISTNTTSATSLDSREMTKVSASSSVAIRAVTSIRATLVIPRL